MDKQYREQEMVDAADRIAESIISAKRSNHHRDKFFPMMIDQMEYKIGAEIGVDKGGFSNHLLSKSNLEKLYCIDCWMDDFGSKHKPEEYDPIGENRMRQAIETLREFEGRTQFIKGFSVEVSHQIPDDSLDFCYIDGAHNLSGIYSDIYTWIHKVKCGGIIAGHDFKDGPNSGIKDYWGGQLPYKIKTVVEDFCQEYGFKLHVVGGRIKSFWFIKTV
ncbi:MAG: class I SAM-dependent methyltransferase [Synergistaceae bacterium]